MADIHRLYHREDWRQYEEEVGPQAALYAAGVTGDEDLTGLPIDRALEGVGFGDGAQMPIAHHADENDLDEVGDAIGRFITHTR